MSHGRRNASALPGIRLPSAEHSFIAQLHLAYSLQRHVASSEISERARAIADTIVGETAECGGRQCSVDIQTELDPVHAPDPCAAEVGIRVQGLMPGYVACFGRSGTMKENTSAAENVAADSVPEEPANDNCEGMVRSGGRRRDRAGGNVHTAVPGARHANRAGAETL